MPQFNPDRLEIIPSQDVQSELFFKTDEEYQEFCRKFLDDVRPDLERQREARQQSESEAKLRRMR
jgi:hypothetical protein